MRNFCGCCGNEIGETATWCGNCVPHLGPYGGPPWNRTYYARYGKPCPFAVNVISVDED